MINIWYVAEWEGSEYKGFKGLVKSCAERGAGAESLGRAHDREIR